MRVVVRAALTAGALSAFAAGGCGEDRGYPAGFAANAARGEEEYKRSIGEKPADAPMPAGRGATNKKPAGADAPGGAEARGRIDARAAQDSGDGRWDSTAARAAMTATDSGGVDDRAADSAASGARDTFESDGVTPSAEGRRVVESLVAELSLPAPPAVAVGAGDEPYQRAARDRRFDEFRAKAARYVQLKKKLLPLGKKLADGIATPEERALHNRIEDALAVEFKPLNAYLWDSRWTEADRAAMGWILFVKPE